MRIRKTTVMGFEQFGFRYQRARNQHKCWCCGQPIVVGEKYSRHSGTMDLKMFTVKYCRACELTSDMLDQNPHLRPAVFCASLSEFIANVALQPKEV